MNEKILEQIRNVLSTDWYAFYLRKSREDMEMEALGAGETLAKHTKILENLAAKHDIHQSQIVVYKEMVSGDSISERPERKSPCRTATTSCPSVYSAMRLSARLRSRELSDLEQAFWLPFINIQMTASVFRSCFCFPCQQ